MYHKILFLILFFFSTSLNATLNHHNVTSGHQAQVAFQYLLEEVVSISTNLSFLALSHLERARISSFEKGFGFGPKLEN